MQSADRVSAQGAEEHLYAFAQSTLGLNVLYEPQRTTTKVKSRVGGWGFYKQGYGHGFAASSMYMYKNDVGKKFMK